MSQWGQPNFQYPLQTGVPLQPQNPQQFQQQFQQQRGLQPVGLPQQPTNFGLQPVGLPQQPTNFGLQPVGLPQQPTNFNLQPLGLPQQPTNFGPQPGFQRPQPSGILGGGQGFLHAHGAGGLPQLPSQQLPGGVNLQQLFLQHSQEQQGSSLKLSWTPSKAEKKNYDSIFRAWDTSGSGFISGQTALEVFGQSGLDKNDLAKIWRLADIDDRGKLNLAEFHVAMGLIYRRLNGNPIPEELPPELVPPSARDLDSSVNFLKDILKNDTRARSPSALDAPVSRLKERSFTSSGAPGAGGRQDATVYRHVEDEPPGGVYQSRARRLDRAAIRAHGDDSPSSDLSDIKRQLENTAKLLDKATEDQASRTAEDEALDREMEDLRYRIKRLQDDLEYVTKGPRSSGKDEERRRLERELLKLMHERLPDVERKIEDRERRKEREKREWARERDRRNERFGRYDDPDSRKYNSRYDGGTRDQDYRRNSREREYDRDRDRDRDRDQDRDFDWDRDRVYDRDSFHRDLSGDRSRTREGISDRRQGNPSPASTPPPPPPPASASRPATQPSAATPPPKSMKDMSPAERQAFIRDQAQQRLLARKAALGVTAPSTTSLVDTSAVQERLAEEKREALEKAKVAERLAEEREMQRKDRLEAAKALKDGRTTPAVTPPPTAAISTSTPTLAAPLSGSTATASTPVAKIVPPPPKPRTRAPPPPPPQKPSVVARGPVPPATAPRAPAPPVAPRAPAPPVVSRAPPPPAVPRAPVPPVSSRDPATPVSPRALAPLAPTAQLTSPPQPVQPQVDPEEEKFRAREELLRKQRADREARIRLLEKEEEEAHRKDREDEARRKDREEEARRKDREAREARIRQLEMEEEEARRAEEEYQNRRQRLLQAKRVPSPAPSSPVMVSPPELTPSQSPVPIASESQPTAAPVQSQIEFSSTNPFSRLMRETSDATPVAISPTNTPLHNTNPFYRPQVVAPSETPSIAAVIPAVPPVKASYFTAQTVSEDDWDDIAERDQDDSSDDELSSSRDTRQKIAQQLFASVLPPASRQMAGPSPTTATSPVQRRTDSPIEFPRPPSAPSAPPVPPAPPAFPEAPVASPTPPAPPVPATFPSFPAPPAFSAPPAPPAPYAPSAPPALSPSFPPAPSAPPPLASTQPTAEAQPTDGFSALLKSIHGGAKLRKAVTNDRSAAGVSGKVLGDAAPPPSITTNSSTPHLSFDAPKALEPLPFVSRDDSSTRESIDWMRGLGVEQGARFTSLPVAAREEDTRFTSSTNIPNIPNIPHIQIAEPAIEGSDSMQDIDTGTEYRVRTLYPYEAARPEELSFFENAILLAFASKSGSDWWYGTSLTDGKTGFIPRTYVQMLEHVTVKAIYPYTATGADQMSLTEGDELVVVDSSDAEWWRVEQDGMIFMVPAAFVEVVEDPLENEKPGVTPFAEGAQVALQQSEHRVSGAQHDASEFEYHSFSDCSDDVLDGTREGTEGDNDAAITEGGVGIEAPGSIHTREVSQSQRSHQRRPAPPVPTQDTNLADKELPPRPADDSLNDEQLLDDAFERYERYKKVHGDTSLNRLSIASLTESLSSPPLSPALPLTRSPSRENESRGYSHLFNFLGRTKTLAVDAEKSRSSLVISGPILNPSDEPNRQGSPAFGSSWSSLVDQSALEGIPAEERRRQEAIFELIATEAAYVRDLQLIVEVFYASMMKLLDEKAITIIFANVEDLLLTNTTFLSLLEERQKDCRLYVDRIGDLIYENISKMSLYKEYCSNQRTAIKILQSLRTSDAALEAHLQSLLSDPALRNLDLSSYLLVPMQRITRYPLLIRQIFSYTNSDQNAKEWEDLTNALSLAENILAYINEKIREQEGRDRLKELSQHLWIGQGQLDLTQPTRFMGERKLLKEGPLLKAKSGRRLCGFLCTDILVLTDDSAKSLYRMPIPLVDVRINKEKLGKDGLTFQLSWAYPRGGESIVLRATSARDCQTWMYAIDAACVKCRAATHARTR